MEEGSLLVLLPAGSNTAVVVVDVAGLRDIKLLTHCHKIFRVKTSFIYRLLVLSGKEPIMDRRERERKPRIRA